VNKKFQRNLEFSKPVLSTQFGNKKTRLIVAEAEVIYFNLQDELPNFQSVVNQKLFEMTFFVYPLYKSLLKITSEKDALSIVKQCSVKVLDGEFTSSWLLRKIHKSSFLIRLLRKWIIGNVNKANDGSGWKYADYIVKPDTLYSFKVTKCGIHGLFKTLAVPELVPVVCELDHYILKYYPKDVQLARAKTIAEGAAYCQFCFTRHQSKHQEALS